MSLDLFEKPEQPMPQPQTEAGNTEVIKHIQNAPAALEEWKARSARAVAALSVITVIETAEQDAQAEQLLTKVRATYEKVVDERKSYTSHLDALKKLLMIPEAAINTDAKATGSEYNRVRGLRNGYAQKQLDLQREKEAAAAKARARDEEFTRLKASIQKSVHDGIIDALVKMEEGIISFLKGITLENYEQKAKTFNVKPVLKKELYESWIFQPYNKTIIAAEDYTKFINQVTDQFTYEKINEHYVNGSEGITGAQAIADKYKANLPQLKAHLDEMEELRKKDAAAAEERQRELEAQQQKEEEQRRQDAEKQKADNEAQIQQSAARENLGHTFTEQITVQEAAADLKGVLVKYEAEITGPKTDVVVILSQCLHGIFTHDSFPGIYKVDGKGNIKIGKDGKPVMQDFVSEIINLYANLRREPIEGLTVTEVVSTTAKAKKA